MILKTGLNVLMRNNIEGMRYSSMNMLRKIIQLFSNQTQDINKEGEKTIPTTSTLDEKNGKWEKIRSKIRIDPNLEHEKIE